MYTGHVAIALGARAARDDLPLWVLVAAAQGCDWVEVACDAVGARSNSGVWSHAYPFVLVAACTAALLVGVWKRSASAGLIVLAVYLSHPLADLVTGYKPLWVGGPPVGLHFIDRPLADLLVQGSACVIGWALYARTLRQSRARRSLLIAPLVALLTLQGISDAILYGRQVLRRHRAMDDGRRTTESNSPGRSQRASRAFDSRFPISRFPTIARR